MVDKYVNTKCGAHLARRAVCRAQCLEGAYPMLLVIPLSFLVEQIFTGHSNNGSNKLPLKILQWNAEGVANKKDALRNRLYEHKIDIACIQETHLTDKIRFPIRRYQCKRIDRAEGRKGGVIILVRNDIQAVEFTKDTNGNAEINGIRIALKTENC
ncbi:hypothetical protein ElyMa_004934500 [Elysia marginata]|uniref:Endonuclease/exonuclease/phosphatase domain-containing protein n=1 Tax=Elysia marginata TaxID=1093978 RepID=A0AAV4IY88_9GAST|nr:hypothetical protein ElyMa_004934500 [Elysia marginata]